MKVQFFIRFSSRFGQSLCISGNCDALGNNIESDALPMSYFNNEFWTATIEIENKKPASIQYSYFLKNEDGEIVWEWGNDKKIDLPKSSIQFIHAIDTWNHSGEFENAFYTTPFQRVLLKSNETKTKKKDVKKYTHLFKVKAPLLKKAEVLCISGSGAFFKNWDIVNPATLIKDGDWWSIKLNLPEEPKSLFYKYGIYNVEQKKFIRLEGGEDRLLNQSNSYNKLTILHDGFVQLPNSTWKGAGVSIPVFSLRSKKSFGVGEFSDLKLLVDWAKKAGLKLIQILPVNDTTATKSRTDSYPYAAISAFALHPVYINLELVAGKKHKALLSSIQKKQKQLNSLPAVDYEEVMHYKTGLLKELYEVMEEECLVKEEFKSFFHLNKHWLESYAAFCFLRDKNGISHFESWPTHSTYDKNKIGKLCASHSKNYKEIAFHYFVQFHLHQQLQQAADYAHNNGIILKGDIPIGIYRYGCDAWVEPELYNLDMQAGAPPDDFTAKGQNWGFPTYNWKKMQENNFEWWRRRFEQMTHYFDSFRIDHILGFFRIWSIPIHAVEGIMGRFVPAIAVDINEFKERGIKTDVQRFCEAYITENILQNIFNSLTQKVKKEFLTPKNSNEFELKKEFTTQKQVEKYFADFEENEENNKLKTGLYDLISNVILFEEPGSEGKRFHFRISMENTFSFKQLDASVQATLKEFYIDYFYRRQDDFWKKEAMHKLPNIKRATNMLICGEDLGMVPNCVKYVINQLGILSLEIQRMPKSPNTEFFHPKDAPYLSVVTPSTHDMSTIRGWWEEDREKTQRFFNTILQQAGTAPVDCEPWVNKAIIQQQLSSPAMWTVFQLQDLLGISKELRRANSNEERINVPAHPKHYWQYRMHLNLEDLIKQKDFSEELKTSIKESGR